MNTLICTGKDGIQSVFQYKFRSEPHDDPREVIFNLIPVTGPYLDFFELIFQVVDDNCLKIVSMTANGQPIYSAQGIPEALIHEAAELFNAKIISSSNSNGAGEFRTEKATKAWNRLVTQGKAVKDEADDRFLYTGYKRIYKPDPGYTNYEPERMELLQQFIDMPFREMAAIKEVWGENEEPEKYDIITADARKLPNEVDFIGLPIDNLFNYLSADHSYADILTRWREGKPVSPGILTTTAESRLQFTDGRHRTLLACLLLKETVPVAVYPFQRELIEKLIGITG